MLDSIYYANEFIYFSNQWYAGFIYFANQIFVAFYSEKYSSRTPGLMKYGDTMRDLALRGYNLKFYDESFRYLR